MHLCLRTRSSPLPNCLSLFLSSSPSLSFSFCLHYNTKAYLNPFLNAAATQFIGRRRQPLLYVGVRSVNGFREPEPDRQTTVAANVNGTGRR